MVEVTTIYTDMTEQLNNLLTVYNARFPDEDQYAHQVRAQCHTDIVPALQALNKTNVESRTTIDIGEKILVPAYREYLHASKELVRARAQLNQKRGEVTAAEQATEHVIHEHVGRMLTPAVETAILKKLNVERQKHSHAEYGVRNVEMKRLRRDQACELSVQVRNTLLESLNDAQNAIAADTMLTPLKMTTTPIYEWDVVSFLPEMMTLNPGLKSFTTLRDEMNVRN